MTVRVQINTKQLTRSLNSKSRVYSTNMRRGLLMAGYALQSDSQRIVPVDTGDLKRSARTVPAIPEPGEGSLAVEVSYSTDYAIYVHEMTNVPHYTPAEAQAKFLEQPARENKAQYVQIISKELAR